MTTPPFATLNARRGLGVAETVDEAILTCVAMIASGQNPDGSASPTAFLISAAQSTADGLGVVSDSTVALGYRWSATSQIYPTTGVPTDAIFGGTYTPQASDMALAFDPSANELYIRCISPVTGLPGWVNVVPLIINGGT